MLIYIQKFRRAQCLDKLRPQHKMQDSDRNKQKIIILNKRDFWLLEMISLNIRLKKHINKYSRMSIISAEVILKITDAD